jgi:hypothetical protein
MLIALSTEFSIELSKKRCRASPVSRAFPSFLIQIETLPPSLMGPRIDKLNIFDILKGYSISLTMENLMKRLSLILALAAALGFQAPQVVAAEKGFMGVLVDHYAQKIKQELPIACMVSGIALAIGGPLASTALGAAFSLGLIMDTIENSNSKISQKHFATVWGISGTASLLALAAGIGLARYGYEQKKAHDKANQNQKTQQNEG